jgi:hypothetical protein
MAYRDELQAALARAEAAERRLEARCAAHPTLPVIARCARCDAGACEACAMPRPDGTSWCTRCFVRRRDRLSRLRWSAAVLVAAAAAAVTAHVVTRERLAPALRTLRMPPSLAAARPTSFAVETAREALARTPCATERVLDLAAALRGIDDMRGVVAALEQFEERCGPTPPLRWEEAQARAALGEHDAALLALEALVDDPGAEAVNLPVILYFRALVGEKLRRLPQVAADLASAVPVDDAEWRLADVGEALGRPCDGAFAVLSWEPPADAATRRRLDDLWVRGGCAALAGRGAQLVSFAPDGAGIAVEAGVNHTRALALVDERAPAVVLSATAAAAAGVAPSGPTLEVVLFGKPRRAQLGVADRIAIGAASAAQVTVAIVEDEPAPGVAAVIGGPFLWRFETAIDRDAGRLTLRARL